MEVTRLHTQCRTDITEATDTTHTRRRTPTPTDTKAIWAIQDMDIAHTWPRCTAVTEAIPATVATVATEVMVMVVTVMVVTVMVLTVMVCTDTDINTTTSERCDVWYSVLMILPFLSLMIK